MGTQDGGADHEMPRRERHLIEQQRCRFLGEIVVIKCSASKRGEVGVSYLMLERIAAVIGAFAKNSNQFDLYRLSPEDYEEHMRPTRSKGPSSGKVGIVRKNVFLQLGKHLGVIDIGKTK